MSEATPGIRLATPERVPRLAAMMRRAFVEEPMMLWAFGGHGDLATRFARFFEIIDASFVESDMLWEAGDSAGAAVWIPPHGPHGADHALVRTV